MLSTSFAVKDHNENVWGFDVLNLAPAGGQHTPLESTLINVNSNVNPNPDTDQSATVPCTPCRTCTP